VEGRESLGIGTAWGVREPLDVLYVDMPPGTGDAQISISQKLPLTGREAYTTVIDRSRWTNRNKQSKTIHSTRYTTGPFCMMLCEVNWPRPNHRASPWMGRWALGSTEWALRSSGWAELVSRSANHLASYRYALGPVDRRGDSVNAAGDCAGGRAQRHGGAAGP
jgi:hypothetical protein